MQARLSNTHLYNFTTETLNVKIPLRKNGYNKTQQTSVHSLEPSTMWFLALVYLCGESDDESSSKRMSEFNYVCSEAKASIVFNFDLLTWKAHLNFFLGIVSLHFKKKLNKQLK